MDAARSFLRRIAGVTSLAVLLGACSTFQNPFSSPTPPPPPAPSSPSVSVEDLVGRWGFASYTKETDRARVERAARGQCGKPYVIARGPTGGVMMHLADNKQPQELILKAESGKTYLGPEGPPGDPRDREIVSFSPDLMVLRWIDSEVSARYGTAVYVRCSAAAPPPPKRRGPRPKPKTPPPEAPPPSR